MSPNSKWSLFAIGSAAICLALGCEEAKRVGNQTIAAVQPSVQVSLSPFLILRGYYVNVANTSDSSSLTNVTVTYTGSSGNSKTQTIGVLKPLQSVIVDPSDVGWTIERHETISVSASGCISKTLQTDILITK